MALRVARDNPVCQYESRAEIAAYHGISLPIDRKRVAKDRNGELKVLKSSSFELWLFRVQKTEGFQSGSLLRSFISGSFNV